MLDRELIVTRRAEDFIPLFRGIPELGDAFFLSMQHWCGIGKRSTELKNWHVYVARQAGQSIAVSGLYERLDTPPGDAWFGWLGVVASRRREGIGSWCLARLWCCDALCHSRSCHFGSPFSGSVQTAGTGVFR